MRCRLAHLVLFVLQLTTGAAWCCYAQPAATAPKCGRIQGAIKDSTGNPVSGVDVSMAGSIERDEATTDGQGHYESVGLSPGRYRVWVKMPAGISGLRFGSDSLNRVVTLVDCNSPVSVDFELPATGSLSGKVLGEDGAAMTDATVQAYVKVDYLQVQFWRTAGARAVVKSDGGFRIDGLPVGHYYVRAAPPAGANPALKQPSSNPAEAPIRAYVPLLYPDAELVDRAVTVPVIAGADNSSVVFRMRRYPRTTLRGVMKFPGAKPEPARSVLYLLSLNQELPAPFEVWPGRTLPEERFEVPGVPQGDFRLFLHSFAAQGSQRLDSWWSGSAQVSVGRQGQTQPLVVELASGRTITGEVKPENGDEKQKIRVTSAAMLAPVTSSPGLGTPMRAKPAEAPLQFSFLHVPSGQYRPLGPGLSDGDMVSRVTCGDDPTPRRVILSDACTHLNYFAEKAGVQVTGVVSRKTGEPRSFAYVVACRATESSLVYPRSSFCRFVDADQRGAFSLYLLAGRYSVYAFESLDATVPLTPEYLQSQARATLRFEARPGESRQIRLEY